MAHVARSLVLLCALPLLVVVACRDESASPPAAKDTPADKPSVSSIAVLADEHTQPTERTESWARALLGLASEDNTPVEVTIHQEPGADLTTLKARADKALAAKPKVLLIAIAVADDITPAEPAEKNKGRFAELLALKAEAGVPEALARAQAAIAETVAACRAAGARCGVVLLPVPLQVDASTHPTYEKQGYEVADWMTGATPLMARLVGWLRSEKIPFVDTAPALKAAAGKALYDPASLQLTPAGVDVVAQTVWTGIRQQGLLGAPVAAEAPGPNPSRTEVAEDAPPEERRLAEKLNGLKDIRAEMQTVLQELPARKKDAEALQADVKAIEKKLSPAVVAKILAESKAELDKRGAPEGSLLYRARGLDKRLKPLMEKELAEPDDPPEIARLKQEVLKQQEATAALGAGTAVAFRALNVIEQMKIALPRLRKAAQTERDAPKKPRVR